MPWSSIERYTASNGHISFLRSTYSICLSHIIFLFIIHAYCITYSLLRNTPYVLHIAYYVIRPAYACNINTTSLCQAELKKLSKDLMRCALDGDTRKMHKLCSWIFKVISKGSVNRKGKL